jgi:hypothetical protein
MALKTENITFDTADPEGLAAWWARALDGRVDPIAPPLKDAALAYEKPYKVVGAGKDLLTPG